MTTPGIVMAPPESFRSGAACGTTARCQVAADLLRSMARYTVERPTQKRSASSAVLCPPVWNNSTRWALLH